MFHVGSCVKVSKLLEDDAEGYLQTLIGYVGVVKKVNPRRQFSIEVKFFNGEEYDFLPEELELVNEV